MIDVHVVLTLAHPLTERGDLPVSPLFVAAVAMTVVFGAGRIATSVGERTRPGPPDAHPPQPSHRLQGPAVTAPEDADGADAATAAAPVPGDPAPEGPAPEDPAPEDPAPQARESGARRGVFLATRLGGLALLALAIVAGQYGAQSQLFNITPALVIGAGWAVLILAAVSFGDIWHWLDPFDSLARIVAPIGAGDGRGEAAHAPAPVWWAMPAAVLWLAYLTMWPNNLAPRMIAGALLIYTVVTLAGCLAYGRRTWLARAEVFGIFFGAIARVRRREWRWEPQLSHAMLLGLASGAFIYGLLRDSRLLQSIGYGARSTLYSAGALAACMFIAALSTRMAARNEERRGVRQLVGIALVPAAAALAVALALARNRFTTSLQILPALARDPLGRARDLIAQRTLEIDPEPFGDGGLLALQIGIIVVGHVIGVFVAAAALRAADARTLPPRFALGPSVALLAALASVAAAAVAAI